jgi:hypothetical protein
MEGEYRTGAVSEYTVKERNGAIRSKCANQKGARIAGKRSQSWQVQRQAAKLLHQQTKLSTVLIFTHVLVLWVAKKAQLVALQLTVS